ncbi:MAG: xanthine dehydrogenase family protein molybdopterin-binding subunit [Rhodospirillaceae bacterium]|nr:xanthine dehydrogenase family protein molybdopterin-binding subunit [Rhodospirillaceae bacterium]
MITTSSEPIIGKPLPRKEDPKLLRGGGRYTDDANAEGQAHGCVVRSVYAHGLIRDIGTAAALAAPGVIAVYTNVDLEAESYGTLKCAFNAEGRGGKPLIKPPRHALAKGKVRHVGDPIAFVVAETREQAREGAELVEVDIDPLPAVTSAVAAAAPDAPQLWDEVPGNLAIDFHFGDTEAIEDAFQRAAHTTSLDLANDRVVVAAMEPRAALAEYDQETERWTVRVGCQGTFGMHNGIAALLNVEPDRVRVLADQTGGSFGMKSGPYPEYLCVAHAARALGRPVKWRDERWESFLSDNHGRGSRIKGELALDSDGNFLALRVTGHADLGGYLSNMGPHSQSMNLVRNLASLYATPLLQVSTKSMFTNATPVGPYRGAGRPEANYFVERLIDKSAREMGIDAIELRRRNLVQPDAMPYKACSGLTYDSGDFPRVLATAVEKADLPGFDARKAESAAKGRLRGRGFCSYLEVTGPPGKEMGGVRFDEDGGVTIVTGTLDYGQGHATPFAQVLADTLGVPFEKIGLLQGDSDELVTGGGTGGSKSAIASGGAIVEAATEVIAKGRAMAAHVLETAEADIEFRDGAFIVAGTDRSISVMDLAAQARAGIPDLPEDIPGDLDVALIHETAPSSFPNGAHAVEVEIDPGTGQVFVVRYAAADDFGVILNPMMVDGQVHGGIVQGLGQALGEQVTFDADGQPLTGSFMDYAMPRADDVPAFDIDYVEVPAKTNALGVKGCGEAGSSGALGAIMNAVVDALSQYGIEHIDMPATPERVWRAIQEARG